MSINEKPKYYFNNEVYGRVYNWNAIFNMFDSLKVPDTVWKPRREILNSKYGVLISSRSIGKTSNVLLLGLCQRALYNTQIVYIRSTENEFTPTEAKKLVQVINEYDGGRYIKQLTKDKYNTIIYKARAFYYALIEDGQVIAKDSEECIKVLTVDRWDDYKSTVNMPRGDFFLFDEFIRTRYQPDEFVKFCDLFKTIARERMSPVIFMLANGINLTSPYYSELEIKSYLRALKDGQHISVSTEDGTRIYIERCAVPPKAKEKRAFFNSLFLGFKNPKLGAITGGQLWALPNVPHLYSREEKERVDYICRQIYIDYEGEYLRLDIVNDDRNGVHLEVVPAGTIKDDAVILTLNPPSDPREIYLLGGRRRKLRRVILDIISEGKVFFATNEQGAVFKSYIERALDKESDPLI